ncbi:Uncharacterized protein BM_BM592 [Brugia malayi]|uniref:Bm592 n=2 Tax=Brugia TaxID=6278 RepID=A0A0H5S8S0_BRUMA|nr:Uncharacterized protein BM_BM592 [Brugia malayi]CRZ25088.1 Bm592 [Brugia malayi]VDO23846.1 unnamed protein product [Brugia timori]VIO98719.1 Uncharacterized protein BM_BM592 [Brugia malayi]
MDRLLAESYDRMVERDKKYRCFVDGGLGKRSFLRVYANEIYNRSELSFSEFGGQSLFSFVKREISKLLKSR